MSPTSNIHLTPTPFSHLILTRVPSVYKNTCARTRMQILHIIHMYIYMFRAICQFAQFRNCAAQITNLRNYLQSTAQFVNYLPICMEQAIIPFANEAREHFSSALECRYGPKKLRRLTLVRARPDR